MDENNYSDHKIMDVKILDVREIAIYKSASESVFIVKYEEDGKVFRRNTIIPSFAAVLEKSIGKVISVWTATYHGRSQNYPVIKPREGM